MAEIAQRLDINFHPNTIDENINILNKLRTRGKVIMKKIQHQKY